MTIPYRKVFEELDKRQIQYLVVGGFAVNLHKVQRATMDLDLIVLLDTKNWGRFVALMKDLGFRSRLPVDPLELANPEKRNEWIAKKNMKVFSFLHASNPLEIIDILVKDLEPFEALWERRLELDAFDAKIKVVSKADLIRMKERAGRPQDLYDITELKKRS